MNALRAETEYDVFVSYAHADNGVAVGSSVLHGWVTTLAANLNEGPNVLKKRLFIDHRLQPGDAFSSDLLTTLDRSAVLVVLLSQNYVESAWCGREVDHFCRMHGGASAPVFMVELVPFERLSGVPPVLQDLRKRTISARFWLQGPDMAGPGLAGYPSPGESAPDARNHYWRVLQELRSALDDRLRARRAAPAPASAAVPASAIAPASAPTPAAPAAPAPARLQAPAGGSAAPWATVLLADATEDLEAQHAAVRQALEPEGCRVVPVGDYVELSPQEFQEAFAADLAQADLFVQLLSPAVGRKGRHAAPKPQLQHQWAAAAGTPILQWTRTLPQPDELADAGHRQLFETDTLRVTHLDDFKSEIVQTLRRLQARRGTGASAAAAPGLAARQIFVDDMAGDNALAERLRSIVRAHAFELRSVPPGLALGAGGIDVKDLLSPCRAGLTIYTDRSRQAMACQRLWYLLRQVTEARAPVARWGVVMHQGTVASEFGIESDQVVQVDEHSLADFLRELDR